MPQQMAFNLWLIAVYIPLFPAVPLAASFFVAPVTPWWAQWLGRMALAGCFAAACWFVSRPRLRELWRRWRVRGVVADAEPGAAADGGGK